MKTGFGASFYNKFYAHELNQFFSAKLYLPSFFSCINKDYNFFIHYYENQEIKNSFKNDANDARPINTGITTVLNVAMKTNKLQFENTTQISDIKVFTNHKNRNSESAAQMTRICRKVRHLKSQLTHKCILIIKHITQIASIQKAIDAPFKALINN
jgi:hypothetical protein